VNWPRIALGGLAAGIVTNIADYVMHGVIMAPTYKRYSQVFTQTESNPLWFTAVAVCISLTMAILFARTRGAWASGVAGGVSFGLFAGLVGVFPHFFHPLTINGFPYYLAWCWGGMTMISAVIGGAVLGAIISRHG
jgi:hypothetical protein